MVSTSIQPLVDPAPVTTPRVSSPAASRGGPVGPDPEVVRPVVHQPAYVRERAFGDQPALSYDEDAGAEALDLVEHVAGDDYGLALVSEAAEQLDGQEPLAGVEPLERFVEDEEVRVVDDGLSQLHPLAHALGVRRDRAAVPRIELNGFDGLAGRAHGIGEPVQGGGQADKLHGRLTLEQPLLLRGNADAAGQGRVSPRVLAENADRSLGRVYQTAQDPEEG